MKSIVKSRLTGKWYQVAKGQNRCEKDFVEVMCYLSISYNDGFDLLYVGVRDDGTKKLRKLSLKRLTKDNSNYLICRKTFFRKKLKILTFDTVNGLMILADGKMRYFSILSRKPMVKHTTIEISLSKIDSSKYNNNVIEFYSNNIV